MGYTREAIKGISWVSGSRVTTRILSFLKTVVLARVLTPSQFGVFGIASLVLAFLEMLTETGINVLLVQSKKNIADYINSAWVVSIIRGLVIGLAMFASAPFIASFFHSSASYGILLLTATIPIVRGFINPAEATMQKELRFHYEFWFKTSIFFLDASLSLVLSLLTHSVYSLVWGILAGAILEVILSFVLLTPRPRFIIEKNYFSEVFHKGKWITAYGLLNYMAENGDNVAVGKIMSASSLGLYQMAYKISILPISEISDVVSRVAFPVYTKISDDRKRLRSAFLKTISLVTVCSAILGLVIFLFPSEIITIILGKKWLAAAPALRVLSIYGVLRTISGPASALFLSVGKQNYVTAMTFVRFFGLLLTIYPLVVMYGLIGAGYSALLSVIIEIPFILYFFKKVFK